MGCGKSKHSVETATTIIKSTNADGTKQTTATKTVKETTAASSSFVQKEAETKSLCVEDTNKKPLATNDEKPAEIFKEDAKVKDSNPTDNSAPTSVENDGKAKEVVSGHEKDNSLSPADATNVSYVVPTSGKVEVGTTEVAKEDEEKRESTLKADDNAKFDNVVAAEEDKMKESNLTTDIKTKTDFMTPTKTEFMTPTLSEDVVGPFEVVKGEEEVKDSKEETTTTTSDEKLVKTINSPSNAKDDNLKVEEKHLVVHASESKKVEAKKEDVVVTESDIAKEKIAPATKTENVQAANVANAAETQEKEP